MDLLFQNIQQMIRHIQTLDELLHVERIVTNKRLQLEMELKNAKD
jgi:hypothetical protein|tara:strand:- start:1072 stop:1206 length:135 start_codon:yes stop_codon:yes gene_type:complete